MTAKKPLFTVIRLHAPWCASCKTMLPDWTKLVDEYAGRVEFQSVNIDEPSGHTYAKRNNVLGIPTILFQKDGETICRVNNAMRYFQLKERINSLLSQ